MFRPAEATSSENLARLNACGHNTAPAWREVMHDACGAAREYLRNMLNEIGGGGRAHGAPTGRRRRVAQIQKAKREASLEAWSSSPSVQLWTTNVRSLPPIISGGNLACQSDTGLLEMGIELSVAALKCPGDLTMLATVGDDPVSLGSVEIGHADEPCTWFQVDVFVSATVVSNVASIVCSSPYLGGVRELFSCHIDRRMCNCRLYAPV